MRGHFSTRILICIVFLAIPVCSQTPRGDASHRIRLGLLDDAREEMVNWKPGVAQQRIVRPAFEKTATGWKKVNASSLPAHMTWTVAFDGKNLGTLETQARSEDGLTPLQAPLTPQSALPLVGSSSEQFAGLLADGGQTKVRRPLIVVSQPYFHNPDGWRRTKLPDEIGALVRTAFRREYPHVDRCKDEEIVKRNWKFPDSALSFPSVYGSKKHSFLVEADLDAGDCGYISEPDDPESVPWFFVAPDGSVRRIGSFMTLLDAGDYDNDGRSEVVFFLSQGENTDGFVLFDSTFKKPVTLAWHYH
ncbi:MAG: hypothetical protein WAL71_10090 [Terriglobales bacterium]|jgi:hypothetical protein